MHQMTRVVIDGPQPNFPLRRHRPKLGEELRDVPHLGGECGQRLLRLGATGLSASAFVSGATGGKSASALLFSGVFVSRLVLRSPSRLLGDMPIVLQYRAAAGHVDN